MRVVFMGTPEFAVPSLLALATATDVIAVYTRPDAVSGRGSAVRATPVKRTALELGIPVFEPRTLRDTEVQAALVALAPDLIVVAAYGLILPPEILDVPPLGAVNVHASLLPRWRGAAPIQRAILAGDTETGVSIMRMEAGLDTGPYCATVRIPIGDRTAAQLTDVLAQSGADALVAALPGIEDGSAEWQPQDDAHATYAEKVSKADVAIHPDLGVNTALRRVRASLPASPARAMIAGKSVTFLDAHAGDAGHSNVPGPGRISADPAGVLLGCSDGALLVTRLKPEGKAAMAAADWARGVRDLAGATWAALT